MADQLVQAVLGWKTGARWWMGPRCPPRPPGEWPSRSRQAAGLRRSARPHQPAASGQPSAGPPRRESGPVMPGRWTWQQDATLRRRYRAGVPRQRVAAALGRSPDTSMPAGGRSASPPTHTAVPGRALPTTCSAPPTRRGCHSPRWRGGSAGRPQRSAGDDTCSGCSDKVRTPGRPPRIRSSAASGGEPPRGELWHTGGWAVRTGDDPTGIGHQGLGVLTGYI